MNKKLTAREIFSFVFGFAGFVLLLCESDKDAYQVFAWVSGFVLIGIAGIPWIPIHRKGGKKLDKR